MVQQIIMTSPLDQVKLDQVKPDAWSYPQYSNPQFADQNQHTTAAVKEATKSVEPAPTAGPALISQEVNGSYISEANRQLTSLSEAVGQDQSTREKLLQYKP